MRTEITNPKDEPASRAAAESERPYFTPAVDIVRYKEEVLIYADLPGSRPEDVEVTFDRGVLQLRAAVSRRVLPGQSVREEYAVGDWRRSFTLSEDYDGARASAEVEAGVLCLRIPKAVEARAHRVQVRAGQG
ncbi:MAG: Hsp20/alpha crystallin family protein [Planctomycetes bacterium]|nr:Hsp20/alpha crystallin family protein [Planctomycetota bacterium]